MKLEFISIRIASKGYTVYKMSPMTATRIMTARDVNKDPDESKACISAMAHSIALAVVGSRNIFAGCQGVVFTPKIHEAEHIQRVVRLLPENTADDTP